MGLWYVVLFLVSLATVVVGLLALVGRLGRNFLIGIHTRYALASDENWYATHRAAAPWLMFGGVAAMMTALAFLPFVFAGMVAGAAETAILLVGLGVLLVSLLGGWLYGARVARQAPAAVPRSGPPTHT